MKRRILTQTLYTLVTSLMKEAKPASQEPSSVLLVYVDPGLWNGAVRLLHDVTLGAEAVVLHVRRPVQLGQRKVERLQRSFG